MFLWALLIPGGVEALDFHYFVQSVAPIFLRARSGAARCYDCHSLESNQSRLRLQPLSPSGVWTAADLRKNYETVLALVDRADPPNSRLLRHPLAQEAGGDPFHTGGKFWTMRDDPEWQTIKRWIEGAKANNKNP